MDKIIIKTFGDFSISYKNVTITEKNRRSKKMWILLKYLIVFRDKLIPQSELIELLWTENKSDKPEGALKTQLHRLRTVLADLKLPDREGLIISTLGTYSFNNSLNYQIDTTEFDEFYKKAKQLEISEKEQASYLLKAFEIYKGDFLHNLSTEKWVIPTNVYYHSMFLQIAHNLIDIFYKYNQFQDLTDVCRKTILIDPLDSKPHYILIKSLFESGDKQTAKKHYYYVIDLYYSHHGINPPSDFVTLYDEIIKSEESFEPELQKISHKLCENDDYEDSKQKGAFFCEFEFFKSIYNLELRGSKRTGKDFQLCLLTLTDKNGNIPESGILCKVMQDLFESISKMLRASDVFARYSSSQYIILLPSVNETKTTPIIKRILDNFYNRGNSFKSKNQNELLINYQYGFGSIENSAKSLVSC